MNSSRNLATARFEILHDADPTEIYAAFFYFPEPDKIFLCVARGPNDHIYGYSVEVHKRDGRRRGGKQVVHQFRMQACEWTRFAICKILMIEHLHELQAFNMSYNQPECSLELPEFE
jgi:hypothetical protein